MARTSDPRYQRSRQALRQALIQLSHEDPERLTVSELSQVSGIDRATFYRHFRDIPELAADTIAALQDEAAAEWIAVSTGSGNQNQEAFEVSSHQWQHLEANRNLYRWALGPNGSPAAHHAVLDALVRAVTHELSLVTPMAFADGVPLKARLIAGGIYATIVGWLQDDDPAPAVEVGAEVLQELTRRFDDSEQLAPLTRA